MIIAICVVIILAGMIGMHYNKLVALKHAIDQAFADIDVQLKNRFDLVENLVNTVKGYASHEQETLTKLTQARTSFLNAGTIQAKSDADAQLTGALKSLFAVSENYPDLKANTNFLYLQQELSNLENKIAASRRFANAAVKEYSVARDSFPSNIVANIFWFPISTAYFTITNEEEKTVPTVQF